VVSKKVRGKPSQRGNWVFPVGGMLTEAVGREYRVDRVTFVHKDKLPRVRKRLGLGATVPERKKIIRGWDFFESANAFAVVRHSGEQEEAERRGLEMVREELSILSVPHMGYSRRRHMGPIVAPGEVPNSYISYLPVGSRGSVREALSEDGVDRTSSAERELEELSGQGVLYKATQDPARETKVDNRWRRELRRASLLIGESIGANDLLKSFVWNMVTLEMLLTRQEDKVLDTLPRRAEAFLGWVLYSEDEDYGRRIRDVYRKRNLLLHQGKRILMIAARCYRYPRDVHLKPTVLRTIGQ